MEDQSLNLCYLIRKELLHKYGTIDRLEAEVLNKNPCIQKVLTHGKKLLTKPMVISNIFFEPKELIQDHVLMCGDAAGMIFPLCGNGMAMSIHAGKILAEQVLTFTQGSIPRNQMEENYQKAWNEAFQSRLFWGRKLQPFMGHNYLSSFSVSMLRLFPSILPYIIQKTHGKSLDPYAKPKI